MPEVGVALGSQLPPVAAAAAGEQGSALQRGARASSMLKWQPLIFFPLILLPASGECTREDHSGGPFGASGTFASDSI